MMIIAIAAGIISCVIYKKKITLDEEEYLRITNILENNDDTVD